MRRWKEADFEALGYAEDADANINMLLSISPTMATDTEMRMADGRETCFYEVLYHQRQVAAVVLGPELSIEITLPRNRHQGSR